MLFKKKKLAKRCSVYISDKHGEVIIAPQHVNNAGIFYEQENCRVISKPFDTEELGRVVMECMDMFSLKDANLRNTKITDWTSFTQSKSKSVRAFEQEYLYISIGSCNKNNLLIDIEGFPNKDSELTIKTTISFFADKNEIGKKVLKVYETCLTGKI